VLPSAHLPQGRGAGNGKTAIASFIEGLVRADSEVRLSYWPANPAKFLVGCR